MTIERRSVKLYEPVQAHKAMNALYQVAKPWIIAGHTLTVELKAETRSTAQNRILWARLSDIARHVEWPVDGRAAKLSAEEWKDILTAGLRKTQRVAQGIEGGFVMLGERTSKMTVREMTELLDLAMAFGDERGVAWSRTSLGRDVPDEVCL